MPSRMMDHQNGMFASPCFSGDLLFPGERQVGFWKMDALKNNQGMKTDAIASTPYRMPIVSSSLDKLVHVDSVGTKCFEDPEQKVSFNLQSHAVGAERALNRSVNVWSAMDLNPVTRSNLNVPLSWDKNNKIPSQYENGLFSSSLSEIFSKNVQLSSKNTYYGHSVDTIAPHCEEDEPFESLEEIEAQTIGNLLPDDDDLLAGVVDGIESTTKPNQGNDVEDLDFFSSVGGMELDDTSSVGPKKSEFPTSSNGQLIAANISFNGEHPFGEVPSRTLFVRNINSNVEDIELQALFEQYGDISTLYTACKHRGFVMISYFDIRAARNAMKALQNKPLRRRRLDIHYSIPKDNPSEKNVSQGTLVAFNLDPYASSEDIFQILSVYGEIKEIREDSHRSDQKFIEFYDIRAADKALHALNQSDIVEKKIKLEPSYPRGLRRSSMQSLPTDVEQKTPDVYEHQSSVGFMQGSMNSTNMENGTGCVASAGILSTLGSSMEHPICHEISSSVPNGLSSFIRDDLTSIQTGFSKSGYSGSQTNCDFLGMPTFNPHSLPKYNDGLANGIPYNADCSMPTTVSSLSQERIENTHLGRLSSSVEMCNGFATSGNASGSLVGHHYKWGGLNHHQPSTFMWQNSPSFSNGFSSPQNQPRVRGLPQSPSHMLNSTLPMNSHRVGSAPSVNPSLWDRQNSYQVGSPETSNFYQGPPGYMRLPGSPMHRLDFVPHNMYPHAGGNGLDLQIPSRNVGFHGHQQRGMMYLGRGQMNTVSFEHPNERAKSRRSESNTQADNKKQFELNIDHIRRGEDTRTTLMIKNIPNKYTSKMLMAAIDEHHRGTYDFIYLPIDFKNKCNVGYAFINLIDPSHVISFYETLNGKKWEKFNSEKVALLAYARIQGKASLVAHFQNSSLMNEDKRCRPILFHSDGNSVGDQVPCPMGVSIRSKPGRSRSSNEEDIQQESPPNVGSAEEYSCKDSCSGSRKESD